MYKLKKRLKDFKVFINRKNILLFLISFIFLFIFSRFDFCVDLVYIENNKALGIDYIDFTDELSSTKDKSLLFDWTPLFIQTSKNAKMKDIVLPSLQEIMIIPSNPYKFGELFKHSKNVFYKDQSELDLFKKPVFWNLFSDISTAKTSSNLYTKQDLTIQNKNLAIVILTSLSTGNIIKRFEVKISKDFNFLWSPAEFLVLKHTKDYARLNKLSSSGNQDLDKYLFDFFSNLNDSTLPSGEYKLTITPR